ncbi:putative formyltransferase [Gordonia effusa NBRC 100432]|uniref:Putative formyltransferase n=1 Tax=Gordonia effusa NBRC 100432 TaxID=1077974 RepID=H0QXQ7_9ACTN|nr:methionyl-tRNA formyltransferase [Gordonia effusa]GAB17608.1 putative formyltransferase [Gordonia effusa NBRC 100432]
MRIVSFGFQTWGQRTLAALIASSHDVVLAVTHPASDDAYKGSWADSVEDLARANDIPVHLTERADAETIDIVKRAEPDLIVVNSWYTWMPKELYDLPPHGTLNLHDSLLPKFTGFSPVLWALISGAEEFGLTVHRMDEQLDTGDILVQKRLPIPPGITGTELVYAGMDLIPGAVEEALAAVESGEPQWRPQDKAARTYFHKRSERDSLVDWTDTAEDLERFVRALSEPYPRAYSFYRGEKIEILAAAISTARYGGTAGRVIVQEGGGAVVCGPDPKRGNNYALVVNRIRTADGTEHEGADFFRRGGYLCDTPQLS